MSFQPLFRRFHDVIQLKQYDENAELREKRDRILNRLREGLRQSKISFEWFNQGSYVMGTGIKPLNRDYDIDIGILLNNVHIEDHDPVEVKGWVYRAVDGHTQRVEWRRPCITVFYQQAGETVYHVDLAIFAKKKYSNGSYLAIGKQHSSKEQREWQLDDRKGFMDAMETKFSGEDKYQLRRVIRYLKRWKDERFSNEGYAAPTGLSLTVAAYYWFRPDRDWRGNYDDLRATHALVQSILQNFNQRWNGNVFVHRLSLRFPCAPNDDVFERMTDQQMQEFHQRLQKLDAGLAEAQRSGNASILRRAFGSDFPES
jgi:hypothetical protein